MLVDINDCSLFSTVSEAVYELTTWMQYAIQMLYENSEESSLNDAAEAYVERETLDYTKFVVNGQLVDAMLYELTDEQYEAVSHNRSKAREIMDVEEPKVACNYAKDFLSGTFSIDSL